jgi:hypothetical protein
MIRRLAMRDCRTTTTTISLVIRLLKLSVDPDVVIAIIDSFDIIIFVFLVLRI